MVDASIPDDNDTRRKRIRVAALTLFAVLLGSAYWLMRPEEGFIVGIVPLSDNESFVLMRANYESGPARGWLIRMHADGHRVWTTALPAAPDAVGVAHGLVTDGSTVVVLTSNTDERTTVVALDARSGRIKWKHGQAGRSYNGIFITRDDFVGVFDGRHGPVVIGLSLENGTRRFTHRPAEDIGIARMDEAQSLLAYRDAGWRVVPLDGVAGERTAMRVPTPGDACLLGRTFYSASQGTLVRTVIEGSAPVTDARLLMPSGPAIEIAETCGVRGEALVFLGKAAATHETYVWIVGKDGTIHRRISLGLDASEHSALAGVRDGADPKHHPLRGSLSRFVPVIVGREPDSLRLVVLNLDRAEIAWASPPRRELLHYQVVRGKGSVHYLMGHMHDFAHVVAIDGSNGHVLGAMDIWTQSLRGTYATDHTLWAFSSEWSDIDALPFIVLDARVLLPQGTPDGVRPSARSALARTFMWLAVPPAFRP